MQGGAATKEESLTAFEELKMKKNARFVTYKIDGEKEVVVDQKGGVEATWDDFLKVLPKTEARFVVYDFLYTTDEKPPREVSKILFIYWSPDEGASRPKMIYAITKEDFKKKLVGIARDVQANNWADLDVKDIEAMLKKL